MTTHHDPPITCADHALRTLGMLRRWLDSDEAIVPDADFRAVIAGELQILTRDLEQCRAALSTADVALRASAIQVSRLERSAMTAEELIAEQRRLIADLKTTNSLQAARIRHLTAQVDTLHGLVAQQRDTLDECHHAIEGAGAGGRAAGGAAMSKISIAGLDKAVVLKALYDTAQPIGMGVWQYRPGDMSIEEARSLISSDTNPDYPWGSPRRGLSFDYLYGRSLKINLDGDELDPRGYDQDQGEETAAHVIAALRAAETADVWR